MGRFERSCQASRGSQVGGERVLVHPNTPEEGEEAPEEVGPKRFFGSVKLDPLRVNRDVPVIVNEVIQHLNSQTGAQVEVKLDVQAQLPEGADESLVRTITSREVYS